MHEEKWWWHLWDGSTSQKGQLVQIYNGNIQQRLILLIGNQSRLLSVILMASGMYQKRAIFHLHVKPCIHLAGLGINEKTFANFSWHICCVLVINLLIPEGNKRPYILRKTWNHMLKAWKNPRAISADSANNQHYTLTPAPSAKIINWLDPRK